LVEADHVIVGLDPFVSKHISQLLHRLAEARAPRIVLSLRPQDEIPDWITHLVHATEGGQLETLGEKEKVLRHLASAAFQWPPRSLVGGTTKGKMTTPPVLTSRDGYGEFDPPAEQGRAVGEPVVEMEGVQIKYGPNAVLGDWQQNVDGTRKDGLWWNVRRGERWGIFGANGSGKTTLLSLVTSDHPQTYSAPVKLFQRSRLPERGVPGITIFDIQSRMGHSSPEVHALFPRNLSVRRTLESAWSDTPITKPNMDADAMKRVDACLRWFELELNPPVAPSGKDGKAGALEWADHFLFGGLTFSAQRVLLFLRATIRNPDIVILDEAFSGMDDLVRDKCLIILNKGERMRMENQDQPQGCVESEIAKRGEVVVPGLLEHQALLCVSHSEQEVPGCVREWICLPEPGTGAPRFGRWNGPLEMRKSRWDEIWDWSQK
jgi:ABC-type molybdenum transport system ATPase subunit/photorepair protein PhrA